MTVEILGYIILCMLCLIAIVVIGLIWLAGQILNSENRREREARKTKWASN